MVQSVERLNPKFQQLALIPDVELLEQAEIRIFHPRTIGYSWLLVADPK